MTSLNVFVTQHNNTLIVILVVIAAGGALTLKLRRSPRLSNMAIYTALVVWLLSLLAAFIWQV